MERLSGLDASFLYLETPAQLLHVCGLIEVDGSTVEGGYSFAKLKKELAQQVRAMPGFRRKLQDSFLNIDHPVWVEDKHFDIDQHLHRIAVPAPGGPDEVAELCAHIAGQPLDRSRPLWEMWVIEGLGNGHIAVMSKMHHATVDGVSGANMMSQLCSLTPDAPPAAEADLAKNAGDAGTLELAVDGMVSFACRPLKLLQMLPGTAAILPKWINRSRHGRAMPAPFTAPRTSFNGTITGHREIAYTQVDLDDVKEVKNAFGCKLNDVVLAMCAGALRKYLDERNELPDTSLVAMVPVSVHGKSKRSGTNQVTGMFTTLRTDVDDPAQRLTEISAHNLVAKEHKDALPASLLQDAAQFAGPAIFGVAMRTYASLRLAEHHPVIHNLVISNVPGPPVPLYFMGARIAAMYPLGPIFHGAGLNITVFSLDGRLNIGLIGCRELTSTLWPLAQAMRDALDDLLSAARAGSDPSGTAPMHTRPAAQE